jgi:hypothetical protein
VFAVLMTVVVTAAIVAWVRMIYFGWMAAANRRQGVDLFRDAPGWNPANFVLAPSLLTERGLEYRRRMFRAALAFLGLCVGGFAAAVLVGLAAGLAMRMAG